MEIENLKYNSQGLIPAIIQDYNTAKVLMLGYMNKESLRLTLETKKTWFYSRSRQKLWNKGETSGNYQEVRNIKYDCDKDTLLIEVIPYGPACHTLNETCFFETIYSNKEEADTKTDSEKVLDLLYERIESRKTEKIEGSYTNYLFEKGIDKILKKVGEEASEVIIASKNDSKEEMVYEISDLFYHLLVLMVDRNVTLEDIRGELYKRYNK